MTHQVNFTPYGKEISTLHSRICNSDQSINWLLLGYDKASNDLKVIESGNGGLEELVEEFHDSKIQYAVCRVNDPNSGLPKVILICWCGQGVPTFKKGLFGSHVNDITNYLKGFNIQINARHEDDIVPSVIMQKVRDSSGAKYSVQERSTVTSISSDSTSQSKSSVSSYKPFTPIPPASTKLQPPSSGTISNSKAYSTFSSTCTTSIFNKQNITTATNTTLSSYHDPSACNSLIHTSAATSSSINISSMHPPSDDEDAFLSPSQRRAKKERDARQVELKYLAQLREQREQEELRSEEEKRQEMRRIASAQQKQREQEQKENLEKERRLIEEDEERKRSAVEAERINHEHAENSRRQREKREEQEPLEKNMAERMRREREEREQEQRELGKEWQKQREDQEVTAGVKADTSVAEETEKSRIEMESLKISHDSISKSGITAIALYDYDASESNELTLREGDAVIEIQKIDDGWWLGRVEGRGEGMFPANYVEEQPAIPDQQLMSHHEHEVELLHHQVQPGSTVPEILPNNASGLTCVALYDFIASEENEVSFAEGDRIVNVEESSDDWWYGEVESKPGNVGYFPRNYVEIVGQ